MEFDNLKSLWNEDKDNNLPEISLEKQKEINTPLDMIKLNMRTEFWLVLLFLVFTVRIKFLEDKESEYALYSTIASVFSVAVIVYFYARLRLFYKKFSAVSPNTNYSLLNLKTELMVTKEIFLSYYVLYIPLNVLSFIIYTGMKKQNDVDTLLCVASIFISVGIILLIRKYWLYFMYGKYIDQIVALIDELNGVDSNYKEKKPTMFEKSQMYFVNKWSLAGNLLNTIIWILLCCVVAVLVLFVILFIIIKGGMMMGWIDILKIKQEMLR